MDTGFWPLARQIDAVLSAGRFVNVPLVLYGSDGHTAWINRAMRTRSGLTREYLRGLTSENLYFYGHDDALEPNGFVVDTGQTVLVVSAQELRDAKVLWTMLGGRIVYGLPP